MNAASNTLARTETDVLHGRYRLGRVIARGGIGVVYEARHAYTGAHVAIKMLGAEYVGDQRARTRLLREAAFLGIVRHPNVVQVLDAGVCPVHGGYLAMELLQGRPLDGWLTSRTRSTVEETLPIVLGLADALSAAHANGIVHRDLKPANVILAGLPGAVRPILVDFGVARELGDRRTGDRLTRDGELPGTLEYMAPELLAGRVADTRTDVYALGVVAFECLTGRVPYPAGFVQYGGSDAASNPISVLRAAGVSDATSSVVAQSIALEQSQRYGSVADFRAALEAAALSDDAARRAGASPASSVESRRAHPRIPYVAPLRVLQTSGYDIDGRSEDIGEGGVLFVCQQHVALGDVVMLRIPMPISGKLATIPSTVRWVKPGRLRTAIGLAFDQLSEAAREEIRRYVEICTVRERSVSAVQS